MIQIVNTIAQLLQQAISALIKIIQLAWTWSFGQIITIFQSNWQALPIWKMVVLAAVVFGIVLMLYKVARQIWSAGEALFRAFVALILVFISVLPYILIAGGIAFAGGYVIKNINF